MALQSSRSPLPSPSPNPSHKRRWRHALSLRHDQLTKESGRLTTRLFSRRALPKLLLHVPTHSDQTEPTPKGKSRAGNHEEEHDDVNVSPCLDFFFRWYLNTISILRMLRLKPPNAVMKKANNKNNLLSSCRPLLLMIPLPQLSWTAGKIAHSGS